MRTIKDYLHLYLGAQWHWTQYSGTFTTGIYGTDTFNSILLREYALGNGLPKPILRPLSSMTEEEAKELDLVDVQIGLLAFGTQLRMYMTADQFCKCLSRHFDIFNLIPDGLAIAAPK